MNIEFQRRAHAVEVSLTRDEKIAVQRAATRRSHELGRPVSLSEFLRELVLREVQPPQSVL